MFVACHAMLATFTGVPEIAITDDDGKNFTRAAQNALRHYSVQTTQKTLDLIAFAGVSASIYFPRLVAYRLRLAAEAGPKPREENVVTFPQGQAMNVGGGYPPNFGQTQPPLN